MSRLSYEQLNKIKIKFGVDKIWSYSKMSTYHQCGHLYKLKYIDKIKGKGQNCYTHWGTVSHSIIQDFYEKIYNSHKEMSDALEGEVLEYLASDNKEIKFNSDSERDNYIENIRHYFANTSIIPYDVVNEKPIFARFEGKKRHIFQGYIDSEYFDEDGNFVILDYKTSSISGFTGKEKLAEKSKQLFIYAIGVSQFGRPQTKGKKIPLDKIKIRYDMMKYVNIRFMQANGKEKVSRAERRLWVAHISNQLRKDLSDREKLIAKLEKEIAKLTRKMNAKCRTPEEVEGLSVAIGDLAYQIEYIQKNELFDVIQSNEMIEQAINNNSLESMPDFVKNKYTVENCYIDVEITDDIVKHVTEEIISTLDEIDEKTEGNHEEEFARGRIQDNESYYCTNLCDLRDKCIHFKEYREHQSMYNNNDVEDDLSDDDLLAMLGLN